MVCPNSTSTLLSYDYGKTFVSNSTIASVGVYGPGYFKFFNGNQGAAFIANDGSSLYWSNDGGQTFGLRNSITNTSMRRSFAISQTGQYITMGTQVYAGNAYITISCNYGYTFKNLQINYNLNTGGLYNTNALTYTVMSADGKYQIIWGAGVNVFYYSVNYGATFVLVYPSMIPYQIVMSNSGKYIIVLASSTGNGIYYSNNYGTSFTKSATFSTFNAVVAGGGDGTLTMNGSGQYAMVVDVNAYIYYTTNYGVSWTLFTTNPYLYPPVYTPNVTMSQDGYYVYITTYTSPMISYYNGPVGVGNLAYDLSMNNNLVMSGNIYLGTTLGASTFGSITGRFIRISEETLHMAYARRLQQLPEPV